MGLYKYEVHAHTSNVSACGFVEAAEAVRMHKKVGYQGIIFTDHFHNDYLVSLGNLSWEEKVDQFMTGYQRAKEEGIKHDMDIFWGVELRFTENENDFLVYGLTEEYLKSHVNLQESNIQDFMKSLEGREDILVIQAHPFRAGCSLVDPLTVHGLEIHNGNPRHNSQDHLADKVAIDNDLFISSGSDFHQPEDLDRGGVYLPERIKSIQHYISMIKKIDREFLILKVKK